MFTYCLLIDDDVEDNFLFKTALFEVAPSCQLVIVEGCQKAVERLLEDVTYLPGMIFLDLTMPITDEKMCSRELRKIVRMKEVPIVIYSTSSYEKDVIETRELGTAGYFVKPGGYQELVKKLRKALTSLSNKEPFFYIGGSSISGSPVL